MERILVLDDDPIFLALIETSLGHTKYEIDAFSNGQQAVEKLQACEYDLIISDLVMPKMGGEAFFAKAKEINPEIPFIFLTANSDLETAVKILKTGADDYICKPVKGQFLQDRVIKTLQEKAQEKLIKKTMSDKIYEKTDQDRIVSWKHLYGMKDIEQTNKLMIYLSRNIEEGGGFTYLDLLKNELRSKGQGEVLIDRALLDLIVNSSEKIKTVIEDLHRVTLLLDETLTLEKITAGDFLAHLQEFFYNDMIPFIASHNRKVSISNAKDVGDCIVSINKEKLFQIVHELICNAIKYSPEESKIFLIVDKKEDSPHKSLEISLWNSPKSTVSKDDKGLSISGIPYEYSEAVFELFHTFEKFPVQIPEEQWKHGTGLYFVRKMLGKMDASIEAHNIVMHTLNKKRPYVSVSMSIPLHDD